MYVFVSSLFRKVTVFQEFFCMIGTGYIHHLRCEFTITHLIWTASGIKSVPQYQYNSFQ